MSARRHQSQPSSAERDDEVRVVVVVGDDQAERVVRGEPAVERELGIEVQRRSTCRSPTRCRARREAQRREVRRSRHTAHTSHAITSSSTHQRVAPARGTSAARASAATRAAMRPPRQGSAKRAEPPRRGRRWTSGACYRHGPRDRGVRRRDEAAAGYSATGSRPRCGERRRARAAAPPRCAARSPGAVVVGVVQQQHGALAGAVGHARGDRVPASRAPPSRGPSGSTAAVRQPRARASASAAALRMPYGGR